MIETIGYPAEEGVHSEEHALLTQLVKLWVSVEQASRNILIEDTKNERWHDSKEHIVKTHRPRLEDDFAGETVLEGVPELGHKQGRVLVIEVQDHLGNSLVRPGSVNKQQFAKESELCNGDIGRTSRLETFNT